MFNPFPLLIAFKAISARDPPAIARMVAGDRATATGPEGWIDLAIPWPAARGAGVSGACGLVPRAILSSFCTVR